MIVSVTFLSVCEPIVRAALSETFDVSEARIRSRCSGACSRMCSFAVSRTSASGRCCRNAVPEAVRSATRRCSWRSWPRSSGSLAAAMVVSSSSPSTAGTAPPSRSAWALSASSLPICCGSAVAPVRVSKSSSTYRSASVRCRAATSITVARFFERPVDQTEMAALAVESSVKTRTIARIVRRARGANGRNARRRNGLTRPPRRCACRP